LLLRKLDAQEGSSTSLFSGRRTSRRSRLFDFRPTRHEHPPRTTARRHGGRGGVTTTMGRRAVTRGTDGPGSIGDQGCRRSDSIYDIARTGPPSSRDSTVPSSSYTRTIQPRSPARTAAGPATLTDRWDPGARPPAGPPRDWQRKLHGGRYARSEAEVGRERVFVVRYETLLQWRPGRRSRGAGATPGGRSAHPGLRAPGFAISSSEVRRRLRMDDRRLERERAPIDPTS
jgi:hypothetical protein